MDKTQKREIRLYVIVWILFIASIPLSMSIHVLLGHDSIFPWRDVWQSWKSMLPFLLLFVLHNHLAIPFLLPKKWGWYAAITLGLLVLFGLYCFSPLSKPPLMDIPPSPWQDSIPGERPAPPGGNRPLEPEAMKFIMGILIILANVGLNAIFRAYRSEQRVQELKAESLNQQLETLRYQINPHFFMNTLNNIHALVDIDPEKAKDSIEEFSKLMRIVLYDGSEPTIPLQREVEYLQHFVTLMRLRYPDSVDIVLDTPAQTGEAEVPPLVMASFVENAFKHGISYESASYVRAAVSLEEDQVVFRCANSRHPSQSAEQHGLGMENLRKRLELLYGPFYTLDIQESADCYSILLKLPAQRTLTP